MGTNLDVQSGEAFQLFWLFKDATLNITTTKYIFITLSVTLKKYFQVSGGGGAGLKKGAY